MPETVITRSDLKFVRWLSFSFGLTGCVLSIDPVVPSDDAIFDPRLLGAWEEVSGTDRADVAQASPTSYAITYTSNGQQSQFEGWLDSLGGRLVMDLRPAHGTGDTDEPAAGLRIAGHLLLVLEIDAENIQIAALEPDSILARIHAKPALLDYRRFPDQLVIGGTTDELRKAIGEMLLSSNVLTEPSMMRRVGEIATAPASVPAMVSCFEAAAWREADLLFRRDRHWVGGDGASSVPLGDGRVLWLFGDSWIDPTGQHSRHGARIISNTVAIQTGTDPATASMTFYWRRGSEGHPAAIVPDNGEERHWFGNGVRVGDRLILFLNRVRTSSNSIGFESVGWTAWMVENADADPSEWRMVQLTTPTNPLGVLLGFAAVRQFGDHLYAFGSQDPVKTHPIYVVRWPMMQVGKGDLLNPEWWAGDRLGWVADSTAAVRQPLFDHGQSELSVHRDTVTGQLLVFQTQGFGPADVVVRTAPTPTGPWTATQMLYRPSEYYRPNAMVYSAKAHPELTGADLVLTYATNTFEFAEHLTDSLIYYPRFVRLTRCE